MSKSNKVSHRDYRTDLLVTAHLPWYGLLIPSGWLPLRAMSPRVMPRRLVMSHLAPHEGHISPITHGTSGERFAPAGPPSRTQKCDAYCHNFMRPRRSARPTIVTETGSFFPYLSSICSHIMKYYSRFFKFCRILFYEMHNYAEYHSKTHKKCINMHIIV